MESEAPIALAAGLVLLTLAAYTAGLVLYTAASGL